MGGKFSKVKFTRGASVDDKLTRPSGLYTHTNLDLKKLRKLILAGKLAPCYVAKESPPAPGAGPAAEECPICFLHYPTLNRSRCCAKAICTECFLQVKVPNGACGSACPFCKSSRYAVDYRGKRSEEEIRAEQVEEQRVAEVQARMREEERRADQERELQRIAEERESAPAASGSSAAPAADAAAEEAPRQQRRRLPPLRPPSRSAPAEPAGDLPIIQGLVAPPSREQLEQQTEQARRNSSEEAERRMTASAQPEATPDHLAIAERLTQFLPRGYRHDNLTDAQLEELMVMDAMWRSLQPGQEGGGASSGEGERTQEEPVEHTRPMTEEEEIAAAIAAVERAEAEEAAQRSLASMETEPQPEDTASDEAQQPAAGEPLREGDASTSTPQAAPVPFDSDGVVAQMLGDIIGGEDHVVCPPWPDQPTGPSSSGTEAADAEEQESNAAKTDSEPCDAGETSRASESSAAGEELQAGVEDEADAANATSGAVPEPSHDDADAVSADQSSSDLVQMEADQGTQAGTLESDEGASPDVGGLDSPTLSEQPAEEEQTASIEDKVDTTDVTLALPGRG